MRTTIARLVLVALLALSLLSPEASAAEPERVRRYWGETSQGLPIRFRLIFDGREWRITTVIVWFTLACEDGTVGETDGVSYGFGPRGPVQPGGGLEIEAIGLWDAMFVSGRLGSHAGSGTFSWISAELTEQDVPQVCSSGDLTYRVERAPLAEASIRAGVAGLARLRGSRVVTADGVRYGFRSSDAAQGMGSRPRVRRYEGRTSQGEEFALHTRLPYADDAMEIFLATVFTCEDATTWWLWSSRFASTSLEGGLFQVESRGSFDVLQIDGTLGAHAGRGTLTHSVAFLNADLHAQLCTSGLLDWRLWRTDEGSIR